MNLHPGFTAAQRTLVLQQVDEVTVLGHHNRVDLAGCLKDLRINGIAQAQLPRRNRLNAQTLPIDLSRQRGR